MADFVEDVRRGALGPFPGSAEGGERVGLVLCRVSVYLLPASLVLLAFGAEAMARAIETQAAQTPPWWLILLTFGVILVFNAMLFALAALAHVVAILGFLLALPAGLAEAWALGRMMDPAAPPRDGIALLGAVGVAALLLGVLFVAFAPLLLLACAVPFVGFLLVAGARRSPSAPRPGAFCHACGAARGAAGPLAACLRCGHVPGEARVTPGQP